LSVAHILRLVGERLGVHTVTICACGSAIALEMESLEENSTLVLEASGLDQQEAREASLINAH